MTYPVPPNATKIIKTLMIFWVPMALIFFYREAEFSAAKASASDC
jgi:hypothetical protein